MANKNKAASAAKEAAAKQAAKNTEKKSAPKIDPVMADAAKVASLGGGLDANHTAGSMTILTQHSVMIYPKRMLTASTSSQHWGMLQSLQRLL